MMNQAHPIPSITPRIRHALAQWACQQYEIRNKYHTNRHIRHTHIWCMLRSFAGTSGLIREWNGQLKAILSYLECSRNTFLASLRWLKENNWLHFDQHCIKIHSERKIYEACGLNHFKRNIDRLFELPNKLDNEIRTHYWIYLAEIDDNRKRQAHVFTQKILQNPELKLWLYGVLSTRGYDIAKAESDPLFIAALLQALYRDDFSSKESEMYDFLVENRPDVNRSVNGMAAAWCTEPMNISYIKKKIEQERIGFVQKIGTISSPGRSRNKHCHLTVADGNTRAKGVGWNKARKVTFQAFCDDISPRMQFAANSQQYKIPDAA